MTLFLRLLPHDDKAAAMDEAVTALREGRADPAVHAVNPDSFHQVPGSPFAYWVSERIRRLFTELPPFEGEGRTVRAGLQTSDDFRFVRAWWEVPAETVLTGKMETAPEEFRRRTLNGKQWVPFAKGGEYSPYYSDLYLVVNWQRDGAQIRSFDLAYIRNEGFYFRPGLTFLRRTSRFCPKVLPLGALFSDGAQGIFSSSEDIKSILAVLSSSIFDFLIKMIVGRTGDAVQFMPGMVGSVPFVPIRRDGHFLENKLATKAVQLMCYESIYKDISLLFYIPHLLLETSKLQNPLNFNEISKNIRMNRRELINFQHRIDELVMEAYGLKNEPHTIHESVQITDLNDTTGPKDLIVELLSYFVGCALARWDIRYATGERAAPELPDPFAPLPACSPGMLTGADGLPLRETPDGYPLRIQWNGILVDDPEHEDDIVHRVREALAVIWGDRADEIEQEACEILGVENLRSFFRKTGADGFWPDHIKRYSKSRRKAPIYWQLATPSGSYAVWLYYHRFTRDTFYKVLNDYVTPKLQYEERKLTERIQEAGPNPTASQRKDIAGQEAFVEELRAFRDEVSRVAPLWSPDLNDGVIVNFAPLWRLVPHHRAWQKECKACWDKLVDGDYDWSRLALHLWPERVVPQCATDRSLAIAHDLDDVFWTEDDNGKGQPRNVSETEIQTLIQAGASPSVKAALEDLLTAPAPAGGTTRRRR